MHNVRPKLHSANFREKKIYLLMNSKSVLILLWWIMMCAHCLLLLLLLHNYNISILQVGSTFVIFHHKPHLKVTICKSQCWTLNDIIPYYPTCCFKIEQWTSTDILIIKCCILNLELFSGPCTVHIANTSIKV